MIDLSDYQLTGTEQPAAKADPKVHAGDAGKPSDGERLEKAILDGKHDARLTKGRAQSAGGKVIRRASELIRNEHYEKAIPLVEGLAKEGNYSALVELAKSCVKLDRIYEAARYASH